ncbi:hypothetical protein FNV43_RR09254 [Rhamnella rubrinervis]|uniref:C2 NT-type domain-containing protein n=1 Tax=Rhamnella rubrinervis TaxID=2594499 RepID=A0A8K0HA47_9ROSA|nr:hypothetical protein FNV43_RR09254 [Rhamnella rubrinervis]
MFMSVRWRSEKNKVKAVFKLQFHATQVPQLGVDALTVSVIPGDVGKPTLKLDKATVRDGTCRWENPVYETVKFFREPRTGKISERIYHFIVSTGSAKAGVLGEISIDFSDYAEATKSSTVSLPLKNSSSNAVLHVLIQRLQANLDQRLQANRDQRDVEECEDAKAKPQGRSLKTHLSNGDADESNMIDGPNNITSHNAELNGNHRASSGSDITLSSSDSSSGLNTPRENGVRNFNVHQEPSSYLLVPHKSAVHSSTIYEEHQRSQWEWPAGSDHGVSVDDSTNSPHNTLLRERSQQASDIEIEKLKAELLVFARQADVSEMELQTLRKQVVKESKRGQDLSREVVSMKEERDALKAECEKLKSFQNRVDDAKFKSRLQTDCGDLRPLLEEIRQELNYEKDLNANLRLQLQKTQESNTELILAVRDLEEMLQQKNGDVPNLTGSIDNAREFRKTFAKYETDEDEEQKALEELVKAHRSANETSLLEQKVIDLYGEIEIYRRDKDELEMQMEQLALDYEILKQENHDISYKLEQSQLQEQLKMQYECSSPFNELESHIEKLEKELTMQSKEFSESLATIKELESHIKNLEEELENQAHRFEADLEALTQSKVEQEQRAIRAEEALRKTRWKNANAAEKLQEEFRRLSTQMASTFDANEKVAMKAMSEASELRMQKIQLAEALQKAKEELQEIRDEYEAKLHELSNQIDEKTSQMEQMSMEIVDKSKQLELIKKQKEEISGAFSQEILQLKAEIERITTENNCISQLVEQNKNLSAELEGAKISVEKTEMLIQRGNVERIELVTAIALVKKEAEKSLEELNKLRNLKDEKEAAVEHLQAELKKLKTEYDDLKNSLSEDEVEKEKLRKQVFQLKNDLRKKEEAITSIEKKLKDSNERVAVSDGTKTSLKNNKSVPVAHGVKEVTNLRKKIKLLEGQIKLKEAALETSATSFLEKEKDLQQKIEELHSRVEELNQSVAFQKVVENCDDRTSKDGVLEEMRSTEKSNEVVSLEECLKASKHEDLLCELALLKERNDSMECELKEMQERYSEISLKFAEVEGERQKLVMTVRYLKNSKKS